MFLWLPPRISVCQHQVISFLEPKFKLVFYCAELWYWLLDSWRAGGVKLRCEYGTISVVPVTTLIVMQNRDTISRVSCPEIVVPWGSSQRHSRHDHSKKRLTIISLHYVQLQALESLSEGEQKYNYFSIERSNSDYLQPVTTCAPTRAMPFANVRADQVYIPSQYPLIISGKLDAAWTAFSS